MYNPINSIIRRAKRKKDEPLNILTFVAHERFEPNLCLTGHNFYSIITDGTREWKEKYSPIPPNYHIFKDTVPDYILNDIDLIVSHNPFVHIPLAHKLQLNVPIINIFHTMPGHGWDNTNIRPDIKQMFDLCNEHVYISEFNKIAWGYDRGTVIHHGLDTEIFKPSSFKRQIRVLTVANDYINRDWALGFSIWKSLYKDFPMFPVGDTPGLSEPAKDIDEIIKFYQESLVFLNTSTASPIPMSLLEAMSCGCACVSSATCMIPEIIEHGVDGFLCSPNKSEKFKEYLHQLLTNTELCHQIGTNARQKIKKMFGLDIFVKKWQDCFWSVLK